MGSPCQGEKRSTAKRIRPKGRQLFCPVHREQRMMSNGQKYFLHLLSPEQLQQRGYNAKKARLVINAYPVFVLSNEWLEELFCTHCGCSRWCHVVKHDKNLHTVQWAPRELWDQVAHVEPSRNPSVSQFSQREAKRHSRRKDGKRFWDVG